MGAARDELMAKTTEIEDLAEKLWEGDPSVLVGINRGVAEQAMALFVTQMAMRIRALELRTSN